MLEYTTKNLRKMKVFNLKIAKVFILAVTLISLSCEDNESGVDLIGLEALFTTEFNLRTVTFNNISNDATSYVWDFGDGTTSTFANPIKTYENGTYTVSLTAFNDNGDSDTIEKTFTLDVVICEDETSENINPADGNINWTFLSTDGNAVFNAFGNIGGSVVTNPSFDGGINTSCNVYKYEKFNGCETWSGVGIELQTELDFTDPSTDKVFTMKVFAENQITDVTLRLERLPFPDTEPSQDRVASITQLGEWQELTFDFSNVNFGTYKSMIIYFERNTPCDGDVYYFDDIIQQ